LSFSQREFGPQDVIDEEDQRLIQGIIPDMILDARGRINGERSKAANN